MYFTNTYITCIKSKRFLIKVIKFNAKQDAGDDDDESGSEVRYTRAFDAESSGGNYYDLVARVPGLEDASKSAGVG